MSFIYKDIGKKIGSKIKFYRKRKTTLSQEQLAEKLNISQSHMSGIERGVKLPGFITFLQIIEELEITPNDLLENVVKTNYSITTSWLAEVISQLPLEKQNCILELVEFMLTKEKNKINKK